MSRKANTKRHPAAPESSVKRTERTPLLESDLVESLAHNKSTTNGAANPVAGVSWGLAAFLLVNTALGAGMLNYPYAYNQVGGILAATLMQIVLLFFITSTMFILVYCADFNQDDTYHDVLMSMCGKRAQQSAAISILLTCYGINVTFLVIIGDQYDRIFESLVYENLDQWFLDRKFTIFMTAVLFIWPMCYAQRLDFLRHASILGMFAMLYVAFLTVYEHYQLDDPTVSKSVADQTLETATNTTNSITTSNFLVTSLSIDKSPLWFESLAIVPVLCFAYQTHEVIVPVYACMKQRFISLFMKASVFGLVILFFLYNIVGIYGYLTFGEDVGPDIMSLYDAKDPVVVIGMVAIVIKFITTYPPLMFCGRSALDRLYGEFRGFSSEEFKSSEKTRRIFITTIWFLSTVALAVFAPNISVTLKLLGSMASLNVFVFPGMCLVSLTRRLRKARIALLLDEAQPNNATLNQQRVKDYYVVSGSYLASVKKNTTCRSESLANQHSQQAHGSPNSTKQNFTATFASLMELEMNASCQFGENSATGCGGKQYRLNNYGSHNNKDLSLDRSINSSIPNGNSNYNQQINQCLQSSWNNRSTTGSILERLGSSIAPSTVAQVGISRTTAFGLHSFSALLMLFGAFIFVLELVHVTGLL